MDFIRNQCGPRFNKGGGHCWGAKGEAPVAGDKEGLGEPPAANGLLRFSHL